MLILAASAGNGSQPLSSSARLLESLPILIGDVGASALEAIMIACASVLACHRSTSRRSPRLKTTTANSCRWRATAAAGHLRCCWS